MKIPFSRHPVLIPENINNALNQVAYTGRLTKGPMVRAFEEVVADYYDVEHAISFGSGTIALYAALLSLKTEPDVPERLIMPSFIYRTVPWAAETAGYHISYEDIYLNTFHLIYELYEENYWYEYMLFMDTFGSIADTEDHDPHLTVIDACHSFGTPKRELRGRGEVFSFAGGKIVSTGEGGMVITNDQDYAESVYTIRNPLSRMSELQAATGLDFMDFIDKILEERRDNAEYYTRELRPEFIPQTIPIDTNNYIYAVLSPHSDTIIELLKDDIDLRKYYYPPLSYPKVTPNACIIGRESICLPNGVNMQNEVEQVTNMLNDTIDNLQAG
jgi:perosamine synthetase